MGVMAPIAVTDTVFSLLRGILFFPFVKQFASLVERLVPQKKGEEAHFSALRHGSMVSPVIACDQALMEVQFMRDVDAEL